MNIDKTNKEYHDDLKKKEKLDSALKSGPPDNPAKKILAMGYPIIVLVTFIGTAIAIVKNRDKMKWQVFVPHIILSIILGSSWGIFMEKLDPEYPAWLFHPWAITNLEWILTIEDWCFYPVFTAFFYVIYRFVKKKDSGSSYWVIMTFQIFHVAVVVFFLIFTHTCGKSIALFFGLLPIFLFFYAADRWNVIHYSKYFIFIVIFASVWDWAAVSWITYIPGNEWASQWVYLTFDKSGNPHHSSVFLEYTANRWAWIFNNPIEISPGLGIMGAMTTYSYVLALDKFADNFKK
ncbi:MAG: hypothetical protein PVI26_11825 [Chitinispirillia bacterium]|jgi:hypothetical protein